MREEPVGQLTVATGHHHLIHGQFVEQGRPVFGHGLFVGLRETLAQTCTDSVCNRVTCWASLVSRCHDSHGFVLVLVSPDAFNTT
jgi:hypothetical protein